MIFFISSSDSITTKI